MLKLNIKDQEFILSDDDSFYLTLSNGVKLEIYESLNIKEGLGIGAYSSLNDDKFMTLFISASAQNSITLNAKFNEED